MFRFNFFLLLHVCSLLASTPPSDNCTGGAPGAEVIFDLEEAETTEGMVTTERTVTTEGMVTSEATASTGVTSEGAVTTEGMVTSKAAVTTEGMVTSKGAVTTEKEVATEETVTSEEEPRPESMDFELDPGTSCRVKTFISHLLPEILFSFRLLENRVLLEITRGYNGLLEITTEY